MEKEETVQSSMELVSEDCTIIIEKE
uniref:Uncharacterized protein n=1 Tax=Moniliophthora roreri TaxID=221103 RepID=A0A0W0FN32_MONRR